MESATILLAEDDTNLGFVTKDNLEIEGYKVLWAKDGQEALALFETHAIDLCLLDVMMPKKDGLTVAAAIRSEDQNVPIVFLTAKGMQENVVEGFKRGGDDYIVKPFSLLELKLRIAVFLKRSQVNPESEKQQQIGQYRFDFDNLLLVYKKEEKRLTFKEAQVLKMLLEKQGSVVKREDILIEVWGENDYFLGRSLDVFISKLRKYLKRDTQISIRNIHGVGFELVVAD